MTSPFVIERDGRGVRVGPEDLASFAAWAAQHEGEAIVARSTGGDLRVCTDFLSVDLDVGREYGKRDPLCYETMVFAPRGRPLDRLTRRYRSRADAASGHAAVVAELLGARP